MTTPVPTLSDIRAACQRLANAHRMLEAVAKAQEAELAEVVKPITEKWAPDLDALAQQKAEAEAHVSELLDAAPQLFKKPRSLSVDGVRVGYRKAEDGLDWPDDATLITRIRAYIPEQAEVLIRTQETIVSDALAQLEPKTLQALGVRVVSGADNPFVTIGDSDVDKLVKAILADAERRVGEAEKPTAKKSKAKLKAPA